MTDFDISSKMPASVGINPVTESFTASLSGNPVNHPKHYQHPCGVECWEITKFMVFGPGNVVKYVFRSQNKGGLQDLEKALEYFEDSRFLNGKISENAESWWLKSSAHIVTPKIEKIIRWESKNLFDDHPRVVFWTSLLSDEREKLGRAIKNLIILAQQP